MYYSVRNLLEVMRKHARWYHWIGFVPAFAVQWVGFFTLLACLRRQWELLPAIGRGRQTGILARRQRTQTTFLVCLLLALNLFVWLIWDDWAMRLAGFVVTVLAAPVIHTLAFRR